MRNEIKIKFENPIYSINEEKGTVGCILNYEILYPELLKDVFPEKAVYFTTGNAFLSENDKWDVNIGKKVSLAKAEQKAYANVMKYCVKTIKNCYKAMCICDMFYEKGEFVINHNDNYISKF
jgi:hypothetical protein